MDLERLKELGGVIVEGRRFESEGHMLRYIVGELKRIQKFNMDPDVEIEDLRADIDELLDKIKNASVRR